MRPEESFIGQPIRSLQTMLRVIAEYDGTVSTVIPDGIYGPETIRSITLFQQNNGLPATGITDQQTWEAIVAYYEDALISVDNADPIEVIWDANKVYIRGDSSPYLYLAQSMLIYLSEIDDSLSSASHSGYLDGQTEAALRSFQNRNALPETGHLDKKTWRHLSRQFTLHANRKR